MKNFSNIPYDCNEILKKKLFPILPLLDIPAMKRVRDYYKYQNGHKLNNLQLAEDEILCDCKSTCVDIKTGEEFNVLFSHTDVENYVYTKAILKYTSVNRSYEVNYLPNGYAGICLIEFPNGLPALLKKLRPEEEDDYALYDILYLTKKM